MSKTSVALIAACAALTGCHMHGGEGGGAHVSRSYQVGNFHQIEVAGSYDVDVRTGSGPSVSAEGSQRLLDHTVVEVQGDKLVIHPENSHAFFNFGWGTHGHAKFLVTVPQLSGATIAGSGGIKIDHVRGQSFDGTVAGSGGIDIATMDVQQLKLSIAGSGGAKAGSGKAQSAEYEIAGSGSIDADGVQAQQVKVDIAGSGPVRARASGTAKVDIMGSGDVSISGGAKCTVDKMGSGNVRCS